MTKAEIVEKVCTTHKNRDLSKAACNEILDTCFDLLGKCIKKDKRFTWPGFGTWSVRNRKARKGRNPQTGLEIKIPASKTIGFRPAPTLKKTL
jgi:DNA-binding protein HU-beta